MEFLECARLKNLFPSNEASKGASRREKIASKGKGNETTTLNRTRRAKQGSRESLQHGRRW